ncbi:fatty acid desaturase family protein [Reichenbachiella agariperforans]|uniref:Linoleoyl-CoA desaturase n=1 Tax=Reichenbachiella agariperforans TaxID=156994 RepID=A0A1M6QHT4_REIAG|nr:acyl-CoA desaturase [Reichenbachiella agariperforans]MBU2914373.1 acyl-CoA desaturase [Reichenbachiella agariperforans]SHK19577.1 linoleoyl-CoA desaturase [Reichenbachiella agariperforans]
MQERATAEKVSFNHEDATSKQFVQTLNKRVNEYFQSKGISKHGNVTLYIKTVVMLSMFIVPYFVVILMEPQGLVALGLMIIMGMGMAGIGLSIMHDAIHGAYSSNRTVNKILGYTLNLVGGNAINWRIQHNVKHHTYTNIEEHDEDIEPKAILRFSPGTKLKPIHKYQYLYAWFFYGLGTFFWVTFKDFAKITRYNKEGLLAKNTKSIAGEYVILILTKVVYYIYAIGVPVYFTSYTGWQIFGGFMLMHFVAGMGLAVIFQPAHLMNEVDFPAPDKDGNMEYSWTVHQLYTTVNFGNQNRILDWYAGGLNFQIEHHLFPHICHVHYKHLAKIVKETAAEYNYPYYAEPTFRSALLAHGRMLKALGLPAKAAA